jgi:hypothetical protein
MRPSKINARCDVRQEVRACLVCWDLLVSFYFYNGRHNERILCARVAPALHLTKFRYQKIPNDPSV